MIHLSTVAGGTVEHVLPLGTTVKAGQLLCRVHPASGPVEEITAPLAAMIEQQRLHQQVAPAFSSVVGLTRVVVASAAGRLTWIATLGPVGTTSLVALIDTGDAVRPHRAGGGGFVGRQFAAPGDWVDAGDPLIELRGDELG